MDIRIELLKCIGVLGFDNGCACISTVDDDDIWSSVADFVIRLHIAATADEEADEDGMIEVFMVVIMKTDAVQQDLSKLLGEVFAVASPEGIEQFFARRLLHGVGEPCADRLDEDLADFFGSFEDDLRGDLYSEKMGELTVNIVKDETIISADNEENS